MQIKTVLLVMGALVGICYSGIPVKNCLPNGAIEVTSVKVYNSSWTCTQEPCPIIKGKNISVAITFKNKGATDIATLMNDVYGIVFRETLPFPDFPSDMINVCNLGGSSKCPIKAGKSFTETAILPVTKLAPSNIQVTVKWEFNTTITEVIGCFEVLLKIE